MNQALGYIMLVVVGLLVAGPLALYAIDNISSNTTTYIDFVELKTKKAAQNVAITHVQHETNPKPKHGIGEIHIHIVNTGLEDIIFKHVLINGIPLKPDNTSTCWDPDKPTKVKGYCFYNGTSGTNLKNEKTPLPIDNNIRLGIVYEIAILQPAIVQLVTDAFKLFEVSIPRSP